MNEEIHESNSGNLNYFKINLMTYTISVSKRPSIANTRYFAFEIKIIRPRIDL